MRCEFQILRSCGLAVADSRILKRRCGLAIADRKIEIRLRICELRTLKKGAQHCILGLNFVTWPGQGNQGTLLSATFLAFNHLLEDLPLKVFVLS